MIIETNGRTLGELEEFGYILEVELKSGEVFKRYGYIKHKSLYSGGCRYVRFAVDAVLLSYDGEDNPEVIITPDEIKKIVVKS